MPWTRLLRYSLAVTLFALCVKSWFKTMRQADALHGIGWGLVAVGGSAIVVFLFLPELLRLGEFVGACFISLLSGDSDKHKESASYARAEELRRRAKIGEAIEEYQRIIRKNPDELTAYLNLLPLLTGEYESLRDRYVRKLEKRFGIDPSAAARMMLKNAGGQEDRAK
jgi:hypothetical protein